jgi:chaperone modulatory protein CbpM
MTETRGLLDAQLLGEGDWIAAAQICQLCRIDLTAVVELADLGLVSPRGSPPEEWQFSATELSRLRTAARLMRDLGVNVTGAALAVELLESQRELERRVRRLERLVHE